MSSAATTITFYDSQIGSMTINPERTETQRNQDNNTEFRDSTREGETQSDGTNIKSVPRYPISTRCKPRVLIISNPGEGKKFLEGYEKDVETMEEMWKSFGANVNPPLKNREVENMRYDLCGFSSSMIGNEPYCVVIVLAHGGYDDLKGEYVCGKSGTDSDILPVEELLQYFDNEKSSKLRRIPKIFILQTCRGDNKPQGSKIDNYGAAATGGTSEVRDMLPRVSDTIIVRPTQAKDVAIVDGNGSWLVQAIAEVFKEFADSCHVADMLTLVNDKMSSKVVINAKDKDLIGVMCGSEFTSTLRMSLHLK